jgi:hypothetical protein
MDYKMGQVFRAATSNRGIRNRGELESIRERAVNSLGPLSLRSS